MKPGRIDEKLIDEVDQIISSPKRQLPRILYHYTTREGLIGIVSNKEVWATHISFLNDTSEYRSTVTMAKEMILRKVESLFPQSTVRPGLRRVYEQMLTVLEPLSSSEIYVFSLTENGDLLSQWRAYCSKGGFSIGFGPQHIRSFSLGQNPVLMMLRPCIYDHEIQWSALKAIIDYYFEETLKHKATEVETHRALRERFRDVIDWFAPLFKDSHFSEEKEWRLILQFQDGVISKSFRTSSSYIIPFIKLRRNDVKLFRESIIYVSPGPHQAECALSAKMLFDANGINNEEIRLSPIPFRNW